MSKRTLFVLLLFVTSVTLGAAKAPAPNQAVNVPRPGPIAPEPPTIPDDLKAIAAGIVAEQQAPDVQPESPIKAEPVPPAPTPEPPKPEPPPKPPEAPVLRIRAPESVELGHLVHVVLEVSGGPIRVVDGKQEWEISCDPPIAPDDWVPNDDPTQIYFTATPGIYTISAMCIGEEKGFARQEARIVIKDPRPPAKTMAEHTPSGPRELLKRWMETIRSKNKEAEAKEVAAAAREVAAKRQANEIDDSQVMEKWEEAAYLRLGAETFRRWKTNPTGKSFFDSIGELYADNAKLANASAANLLENLADILEGK
jgi:hypothetical protein